MKKIFIIVTVFLLFIFNKSIFCQVPPPSPTPLDSELFKQFKAIDAIAKIKWNGKQYCNTTYSVELFPSNSDLGSGLFKANAIQNVTEYLAALDSFRVKGVSISINYPVLVNSFSNSSQYLSFYKQVVKAVRNKGLKILISCQASDRDTLWGKVNVESFYTGLNCKRYKTEKLQMLQTIIDTLQPDFLTLENEPAFMLNNTDLDFGVDSVTSYVNYFGKNLNKKATKIGAGTGSWEDLNYVINFSKIQKLDYIDMHIGHIYYYDFYNNTILIDSIAKKYGKEIILGNSWLYKISKYELANGTASNDSILTRNVYDTFFSCDSFFVQSVYKLSNIIQSQFTSFNKPQYFFGYLKYDSAVYKHMPLYQIINKSNKIISQNIQKKDLSLSGMIYSYIMKNYCGIGINEFQVPGFRIQVNPNPTNQIAVISYKLSEKTHAIIELYDLTGRKVDNLLDQNVSQGEHSVNLNTKDLNEGMYFIKLQTDNNSSTAKIIVKH